MDENRYWAIDTEGSGGKPSEIVELGMFEIVDLRLTGVQRHWRVRPRGLIDYYATRIHGLTDADVASAPYIEDISDDVLVALGDTPIVGHNVRVELAMISRSIPSWTPRKAFDTVRLAKTLRPGLESYKLEKLGVAFGHAERAAKLSLRQPHAALYDAALTGMVFIDLVSSVPVLLREKTLHNVEIMHSRRATAETRAVQAGP